MRFLTTAIATLTVAAAGTMPAVGQAVAKRPDFAGRDRAYAYLRSSILEELRKRPNFARNFTIVTNGCGTGCTSNLIVNRLTGKVSDVPYGGEDQQSLTLRYTVNSNIMVATWFDGDICRSQTSRWTGSAFLITTSPKARPDAVCNAA